MREVMKKGSTFMTYEFTGEEFKRLLGIDWPGGVLTVENEFTGDQTVTVTMSDLPNKLTGTDWLNRPLTPKETSEVQERENPKPAKPNLWQRFMRVFIFLTGYPVEDWPPGKEAVAAYDHNHGL
jgi:hypothetical protein